MSRYHKAAVDGNLDILKEATTKDLNTADEDGMTPTLLAAFNGRVDALQLICSRGGDPNKSDIWGNTPLHLAAANNHMQILSFLVNFGANLFALDNEFHTAMDVAAARDRMDCVRFLDASASQETNQHPKKVAIKKKEAIKQAERRVNQCEKVKKKHQNKMDKMYRPSQGFGSVTEASMEATNINALASLSEKNMINKGGSLSARVKDTLQKRLGKKGKDPIQESGAKGNVIFLKPDDGKPEFLEVFNEQDEDVSEENDNNEDAEEEVQVKQSIFNRPGLGGLIFQQNMGLETDEFPSGGNENLGYLFQNEALEGEDELWLEADGQLPWEQVDLGLDDDEDEDTSPLDAFLSSIALPEFTLAFNKEHLDLEALMLCSDEDLKGIRIQLGPRKKILEAIARRKYALESPGIMKDSSL
ncbi:ankyrin repeat and SAM domain-containing protein 4B [Boleophthalmus pectinirostris]|uniref:ankyrin repeat and SAM domain-containing protein 4B n=1 Tax=Boleophthalmus pectinirostris TaxID=150288 RepID=UPI000A1C2AEB|nr:ankyrin repeat and SAM domain-containing protein 4B [Boleophthalmus pectinirostris]